MRVISLTLTHNGDEILGTGTMSLEESCLKVVKLLTQHDLITEKLSEEGICQCINELKENSFGGAFPLQIVPYLNPNIVINIVHYDDCNTYQEDGYYVAELTKLGLHSQGHLNFADLRQDYDDQGRVVLTYTLNEEAGKLVFDDQDTRDEVPYEYIQFIKTICDRVSGTHRYLHYEEEICLGYCLFPAMVADELEAIQANVFFKEHCEGVILRFPQNVDRPN